jgi:hypothetical protein
MSTTKPVETPAAEPQLVEEMSKMQDEPLLPVEIKLVVTSLVLGVSLLGLLWLLSALVFTTGK